MNSLLNLIKEADQTSLSRVISVGLIILFIIVSIYLVVSGKTWGNYSDFAYVTVLGGTGAQMANKFINSKYNTKQGCVGKPINNNIVNNNRGDI